VDFWKFICKYLGLIVFSFSMQFGCVYSQDNMTGLILKIVSYKEGGAKDYML